MNNLTYTVANDNFAAVGIHKGDTLLFSGGKPKKGDFTLFQYDGQQQLVWLIGYDFLKHPILCHRCYEYPEAVSFARDITLSGRMNKEAKGGASV